MSAIVDTPEEAAALELAPLLVRRPLEAHLDAHGLGSGPVEAEPIGEGHSNITYVIRREGGEWVLRRPPRPPLPPSAHDVLREARLLTAVEDADVRTPRVLLACADESVIGAPFYVMEKVEGDVITHQVPERLDNPAERARIGEELIDALVEIHAVDWRAAGLEGYGKPTGYLERQVRRFAGLWEHNSTRPVPEVDEATEWLRDNVPESPPATIVHGDYRLGNTMFGPGTPARLVAIFDWELATIGDPLADLGYLTVTYAQPGDLSRDEGATPIAALSGVTTAEGFPTRDELIARYEARSGRSMSNLSWYQTLALWKSAVFLEGSYKRLLAGTTDDPFFKLLDEGVPAIARRALAIAHGDGEGLLVDFGGVLTSNVFESFQAFCTAEGLAADTVRDRFRGDPQAQQLLFDLEEGRLTEEEFEPRFAAVLGVPEPAGLIDRLFGGMRADEEMLAAVAAAKRAGVRTGLISNSWGKGRYDRSRFPELFDGTVISGEVGIRKPFPEIYAMGARAVGLAPDECVFVDDLPPNLKPAAQLGMATVHHVSAQETIPQLEELLGVSLR